MRNLNNAACVRTPNSSTTNKVEAPPRNQQVIGGQMVPDSIAAMKSCHFTFLPFFLGVLPRHQISPVFVR